MSSLLLGANGGVIDLTQGLISHYLLNNNSDDSYGNYDGTDTDIVYTGDSADFNGSTSVIDTGFIDSNTISTYSVWFKSDINTGGYGFNSVVVGTDYDGQYLPFQLRVWQDGSNQLSIGTYSDPTSANIITTFSDTVEFHHVVIIRNGAVFSLYLDNIHIETATLFNVTNSRNVFIGKYPALSGYFDGKISNLRIYNETKEQAFITALYDEGYL